MSRYNAYIRNAAFMLNEYDGSLPLAAFLKKHFSLVKKYGSKDRKEIAALCYQYFRLGHLADHLPIEEKLLAADFIFRGNESDIIKNLKPEWAATDSTSMKERILVMGLEWNPALHTPWLYLLQKDYSPEQFAQSHLSQPDLFIRIRPGRRKKVLEALAAAQLDVEKLEDDCLRLPNGLELENILRINREVIIQDYSSQKCGAVIKTHLKELKGILWDACAASGGKSIMMHDFYPGKLRIVATDIRASILHNLKTRYTEAGVPVNHVMVADLTKPLVYKNLEADVALVDVPCSGSGTWSRTPEQHYFFQQGNLHAFSERQYQITRNVIDHVKPNGYIIYITCSVFEAENGFVTDRLVSDTKLNLLHSEVIDGTALNADSMYIAILQKN